MQKRKSNSNSKITNKNNKKALIAKPKHERLPEIIDPLKRYLMEVSKYPVLTEEEERALADKYRNQKDIDAARKLVNCHLRLVGKIAMEYRSAYHNVLDLIQEGNIGLLQAVKKYDPEKGARLAHYATWWIKSYILKFILDNFRLIKLGTTKTQKKLFFNLMKEKENIEKQGFKPTPEYLAEKFDTSPEVIREMEERLTQPEMALEAPVGSSDHEVLLKDFISNDEAPIEDQVAESQMSDILKAKLEEFAGQLNEKEIKIFRERLLAELPKTLQTIADEYGITKERIRQIEANILKKLRIFFKEKGIEVDLAPGA